MHMYSVIGSVLTVVSFALFVGIVAWAWSKRRKQAFDAAARAPFALPDDLAPPTPGRTVRPTSGAPANGPGDSPGGAATHHGVR
jgi:cytochrome c oxidase cbb3-type subunit 4